MLLVRYDYKNQPQPFIYDQLTRLYVKHISDGFIIEFDDVVYVLLDLDNHVVCFQKGNILTRNEHTEEMLRRIKQMEEES